MSRAIAGLACRIRVPIRQYQAVAVLVRERKHVIRLMHRDAGLSIDIEEFDAFETAEEYRDRLSDFLDLPTLTLAGAPAGEDAAPARVPPVRRNRMLKARRPRFLTRRNPGKPVSIRKVDGREIIARN